MVDIGSVSAALGSIKIATEIAKAIKESNTSLEQAEVKLQIAELVGALADAKIDIAEIQTQLAEKDQLINDLREQLSTANKVVWERPYYWLEGDEERDGPFCQKCYDEDKKLIRLQGGGEKMWHCRSCQSQYRDKNYVSPNRVVKRSRL